MIRNQTDNTGCYQLIIATRRGILLAYGWIFVSVQNLRKFGTLDEKDYFTLNDIDVR